MNLTVPVHQSTVDAPTLSTFCGHCEETILNSVMIIRDSKLREAVCSANVIILCTFLVYLPFFSVDTVISNRIEIQLFLYA